MSDTKHRLRKAAIKLFIDKGYASATIGAIEAAAGLAPRAGSFYRHYKSKQELLVDIAKVEITEQPAEFGFEQILELRNTKSELLLIGQTYEKASQRQKPLLPLIEEIRRLPMGAKLEQQVNREMLKELVGWLSKKPAATAMSLSQRKSLAMMIFGGWLFYLTKWQQNISIRGLDRSELLHMWADHWSKMLDQPTG